MTGNYLFYRSVSEFFEPPVNPVLPVLNPHSLNHPVNPSFTGGKGFIIGEYFTTVKIQPADFTPLKYVAC
ncbi:hypothetical protein [Dickeya dadantii]|uniref:hypothetical protein n=1 Tax=Dickeya dadantii TaxID=204038 RepID=UPI0014960493|nr:hypothetical protein [Dickeya dadantii]NPE51463.1 hypothetical protein [Dickeya dadantii]